MGNSPLSRGRFGVHGGQYVPEGLMQALAELEDAYEKAQADPAFTAELAHLFDTYANRPSLLYYARNMTADLGGAKIYLKREDLNHTGAHRSTTYWAKLCLQSAWERRALLQRQVLVSMVLPLLPPLLFLE